MRPPRRNLEQRYGATATQPAVRILLDTFKLVNDFFTIEFPLKVRESTLDIMYQNLMTTMMAETTPRDTREKIRQFLVVYDQGLLSRRNAPTQNRDTMIQLDQETFKFWFTAYTILGETAFNGDVAQPVLSELFERLQNLFAFEFRLSFREETSGRLQAQLVQYSRDNPSEYSTRVRSLLFKFEEMTLLQRLNQLTTRIETIRLDVNTFDFWFGAYMLFGKDKFERIVRGLEPIRPIRPP